MKPRRILSTARLSFPLATALAALFSAQTAFAVDTTSSAWTGTTSVTWATTTNWSPNTVPSATRSALFGSSFIGANQPQLGAVGTAQGIHLADGATQNVTITGLTSARILNITGTAELGGQTNAGIMLNDVTGTNNSLTIGNLVTTTLTNNTGFYVNSAGTLTFSGSGTLNLNARTLTLAGTGTSGITNISQVISNETGAVIVNTSGTVTLSGTNTYGAAGTNYTTLTAGTLNLNNTRAVGDGTFTINGGKIDTTNATVGLSVSNNAQIWGGNYEFVGTSNFNLGTGTVNLNGGTRTITATANTLTVGGVISNGALTKDGAGTLRLNGVNTLTGAVQVSNGILQIGSYTGLSTAGSLTVSGGGTSNLQLVQVGTGTTTNTINKALSLHGTLSIGGGSASDRLNQTWAGTTTLAGNSTITNNGNSAFFITGGIDLGAHTLTYQADGASSRINGNIIGTGSLVKTNAQDLTLFGNNTYSGTTTVTGGTLRFVTPQTLYGSDESKWTAANINVKSGATLAFNVSAPTQFTNAQITTLLTNLAVSNSATEGMNAGSNFAFNTDTAPNTFTIPDVIADSTGASGGARGLTKQGIGTLTLTSPNTYTGATTVSGGTLRLENTSASSSITLGSGTILQVGTDTAYSGPRIVSTAGTIVSDRATAGAGLTHVFSGVSRLGSGNTNFTAGANVTSGTAAIQFASFDNDNGSTANFGLNPTTANVIVTGGVNMGGGANAGIGNFTLGGTGSVNSIGGNIENGARATANLIKQGSSTWTLSGANTYNGTTAVNGGLLVLDYVSNSQDNSKLSDTGALTLGNATLQLSGGSHPEIVLSTSLTANTASLVTRSSGTSVLQMNEITRSAGATINFSAPGIATTDTANTNGILGTWATIAGTDFAANSGGLDGLITAPVYTDVTRQASGTKVIADVAADNVRIIEGTTGGAADIALAAGVTTINTLNQSTDGGTGAAVIDPNGQTLRTHAILAGPTAGTLTIGNGVNNGTLTTATAGGELRLINNSANGITINSVINDNTTASTLVKAGPGTVTLGATNGYTGATTISEGTLKFNADNPATLTGGLTFGSSTGSPLTGSLDLTAASASFGSLNVLTNSAGGNTIATSAGRTLTIGGNVTVGVNVADAVASLVTTGAGNMLVGTGGAGTFQVGGATGGTLAGSSAVDLSSLTSFTLNYGSTGTLRVGDANTGSNNPVPSTLKLAANNIITVGNLRVGDGSGGAATHVLTLGSGTNTINATTVNIGSAGAGIRSGGSMSFDPADTTGTLTLQGFAGEGARTTLNVINTSGGTAVGFTSIVNLAGHTSNILASTLTMATRSGANAGSGTATLTFDQGSLDVTTLNMSNRSGSVSSTTATVNLGDSVAVGVPTVTIGGVTMAVSGATAGTATANLNISGGNVTIGIGSGTAINMANAGAAATATSALNITGGTVTVTGDIIRTVGAGTETATLALNSANAVLDMSGKNITSLTGISYTDGTVKNLGTVNTGMTLAGTGSRVFDQGALFLSGAIQGAITGTSVGLDKQGLGKLTLSGTSTYTGTTTVTAGSLIINGAVASTSVVVNGSLGGSGTMAAATLSGSGSIDPGNSPGILTAAAVDPSGGLDFNFEFTAANAQPTWSNSAASGNDVMRLTGGTPFLTALGGSNVMNIFLNVGSLTEGDVFTGGFYTDQNTDFIGSVSGGGFNYFIADGGGTTSYGGTMYSAYAGTVGLATVSQSADFGAGVVSGFTTQFTVIPEPNVAALLGSLGAFALLRRRRN